MERVDRPIGLMAGTFDPPHLGHLIMAQLALSQLGLQQVRFLPVGQPTHKSTLTLAKHRVEMTRLSIQDNPDFLLDLTDVERSGPHYTATLLPILQKAHPQADLILLIGGDSLAAFSEWYRPVDILGLCRLGILKRPGHEIDIPAIDQKIGLPPKQPENEAAFQTLEDRIDWLAGPSISISSTYIREAIPASRSVRYLIHDDVKTYIDRHSIYTG